MMSRGFESESAQHAITCFGTVTFSAFMLWDDVCLLSLSGCLKRCRGQRGSANDFASIRLAHFTEPFINF